jgi:hypothetical protein
MKRVIIRSQLSDQDIEALAKEMSAMPGDTYPELGRLFRRILPRLLEGWTEEDVGKLTIREINALGDEITRALERRRLRQLPPLTPPTA